MHSDRRHDNRSSVSVVAWVRNVLDVKGAKYASPEVRRVIVLEDSFASIGQRAISKQKSLTAQCRVIAMIAGYTIAYKRRTSSVELSMPYAAIQTRTYLGGVVRLRVCERLVMSFIPTRTSEQSNSFSNWLLDVEAEAVLHSSLLSMCLYVGSAITPRQECINCLAVAAHVCVI